MTESELAQIKSGEYLREYTTQRVRNLYRLYQNHDDVRHTCMLVLENLKASFINQLRRPCRGLPLHACSIPPTLARASRRAPRWRELSRGEWCPL